MRNVLSVLVTAIVGSMLLSGCAKGVDQRLTRLQYMPSKAAVANSGPAIAVSIPSEAHGLPRNAGGEPIVADIVTSSGRRTAGVVVVESIPNWVGHAVVGELRAAGVNAGLGLEPKPDRTVVKTEIDQIKNESKTQWSTTRVDTTIKLSFIVERDGKKLGDVEGTGNAGIERAGEFKDVVHDSMEKALRDAILRALPKLVELSK